MALLFLLPPPPPPPLPNPNPTTKTPSLGHQRPFTSPPPRRRITVAAALPRPPPPPSGPSHPPSSLSDSLRRHSVLLLQLTTAISASLAVSRARASPIPPPTTTATIASADHAAESSDSSVEQAAEAELRAAFETWKSKTYALTVPLKIVALRGSVPPSWIKDFIQSQGRRMKLNCDYRGSLESIFSDLTAARRKGRVEPMSAMAADIVSVGDSWLSYAIREGLVEPIPHVEDQDWFSGLNDKWKAYLCRNDKGELDSTGYMWGAPYRWGTMVIAYKKKNFRKRNLAPIEDWGDLWRPELAGRISIVDSPREVVGAVLKHMGASYNTQDMDSQVTGGREAVMNNLRVLQRQVRLFDATHYLKAFAAGDVWVAVGWSSDVIPAAKRMSDVAVIVPKSGSSLWVDLWAVPSATRFTTDKIGGRVRGPSPLIHQWIAFCLHIARGLPFQQEVIPGASPLALGDLSTQGPREHSRGRPKLDTNLIDGRPPPDILARCEFLEPLSEQASEDYSWLISGMQKPGSGWLGSILNHFSLLVSTYKSKQQAK